MSETGVLSIVTNGFTSFIKALIDMGLTQGQSYGVLGVIALLIGLVCIKFGGTVMKFLIIILVLFVLGVAFGVI